MSMKFLLVVSTCLMLAFGACRAKGPSGPEDQKDKEGYSLGYQFGKNMRFEGTELDLDAYQDGLRDALDGKDPRMTQEEMRNTIASFQQRMTAAQQKRQGDQAEKNLAEGRAFLAENGKKEGVRTLPSGLQYKVLAGGSGRMPGKSDTVTVHYRGTFTNGKEFESSYGRAVPPTFQVEGLIPGWTEALQMMREGAKWVLYLSPDLAYGVKGSPAVIPSNSVLIFEIDLISIQQ
jgi:FKBP-type peptidyl-prolyl cis-trans isomerase FklB